MRFKHASAGFALPVALVFVLAACGQNANQNQPLNNEPAPGQTASNYPMQNPPMQSPATPMQTPPATGTTAGQAGGGQFDVLAGNTGYVTRDQAASDLWLSNHFNQCDSDQNGRVTRDEYNACRQQGGSMPPSGSTGQE